MTPSPLVRPVEDLSAHHGSSIPGFALCCRQGQNPIKAMARGPWWQPSPFNKPLLMLAMAALIGSALPAQGLAVQEGRRRCLALLQRRTQDSPSASSSLIG